MTTPVPDQPVPGQPAPRRIPLSAAEGAFRTALRDVLVLVGSLAVVGSVVGWFVAGWPGVWGALLGAGIALIFSGTTILAMLRTTRVDATQMAAVVGGTWLAKIVVVVIALLVLRGQDFYHRGVFVAVLLVGALGAVALDVRAVQRARVPYIEPALPEPGAGPEHGRE